MSEFKFFSAPAMDRLVGLVWQLSEEVFTMRARTIALEQALNEGAVLAEGALDELAKRSEWDEERRADADEFCARLVRAVTEADDHRAPLRRQLERQLAEHP